MLKLNVRVEGFSSLQHALLSGGEWMRRPFYADKGLVGKLDKIFVKHSEKVWETQGGVLGKPWPPLSEGYRHWKEQHYPGRSLMHRKLRLIRSFIQPNGRDHVAKRNSRATAAEFGTHVPYMKYHQQVTPGRGLLPMRALIGLPQPFQNDYSKAMQDSFYDFMKPKVNDGRI